VTWLVRCGEGRHRENRGVRGQLLVFCVPQTEDVVHMLQHDVLEATSGANQRHVVLPCMADGFERALCVAIRGRGAQ